MLNAPCLLWVGNQLSSITGTKAASEEVSERLREKGWNVLSVSNKRSVVLRLIDMVSATIRFRNKYEAVLGDVYSGNAFRDGEIISALVRRLGGRLILVLHGGGLLEFSQKHPSRVRRLLQSATCVVTPSLFLKRGFARCREDIQYVPNAVEVSRFRSSTRHKPKPSLCWLRAFHQIYNPEMAVQATGLLAGWFPEVRLRMAGPDKGDGSLQHARSLAEKLGIEKRVEWTGALHKSDIPAFLCEGDVFLNTTNFESFGVSTLEAASTGMCLVTTNAGELPLLWKDGDSALIVPRGDAKAMAEAVRRILTEPHLASRLGANARRAAQRFDWAQVLPQWEKLLLSVCAKTTQYTLIPPRLPASATSVEPACKSL